MSDLFRPPDAGTLRLYLIRHGVTDWNTLGRMQGRSDIPLSPLGERQAEAVAAYLASVSFEAVFTSDLARAVETGRRIAERHGIGIRALPDLRETMLGDWEGLTEAEIVARGEGERLAQYRRNPAAVRPPGSESVASIVAVVGHGGSLRVLFCEALGAPARCMFAFRLDNASVSVLDFGPIRSSILATNITYHLAKLSARAEAKP